MDPNRKKIKSEWENILIRLKEAIKYMFTIKKKSKKRINVWFQMKKKKCLKAQKKRKEKKICVRELKSAKKKRYEDWRKKNKFWGILLCKI